PGAGAHCDGFGDRHVGAARHTPPAIVELAPTPAVLEDDGRITLYGITVTPVQEGNQNGPQVGSLGGEPVLVAHRPLLVGPFDDDPVLEQPLQAALEDVAGHPEIPLQIVEATDAQEDVAHDQYRPPLTDDLERGSHRAVLGWVVPVQHASSIAHVSGHCIALCNSALCIHFVTQLTALRGDTQSPSAARPTLTALVVLTGLFLSSLDLFIVNFAFPSISRSFHGESLRSMSWVLSAYTIVFASLLVPAGRWADRTGRKKAFLLGLGIFTASSALCAVAP